MLNLDTILGYIATKFDYGYIQDCILEQVEEEDEEKKEGEEEKGEEK